MLIRKAFRFRVYPSPAQAARMAAWEAGLRFLWNLAHEQRLLGLARSRAERRYYTAFDQINQLTELRAEVAWLADIPRDVSNQLLIELDKAWQRCFLRLGQAPRFKRKRGPPVNLCAPSRKGFRLADGLLRFAKLGAMRCVQHRPLAGSQRTCSLVRDGDQWFASVMSEVDLPDPEARSGPCVGLDRGIRSFVADSDGVLQGNPCFLARRLPQLARANRVLARRKKGSKNRQKAASRVARIHRKIRRQRDHFLHTLSHRYAKSHGIIAVEALETKAMMAVRGVLARSIADAGWAKFVDYLRYKLEWSGGRLVEVPAHYSSQECSACGAIDAKSRKGESFVCTTCGYRDHSDLNAAKVLKARASRSCLPTEASGLPSRRSGKVKLRVPRRPQSPATPD